MDLFCPHCTRRVTVPDEKAGLILNCPLCGKQFMAPTLPPPMTPPPRPVPPPSPPVSFSTGASAPPSSSPAPSPAPPPSVPPPPPGDYTRTIRFHLRGTWLAFVPLVCLLLIFVLSFFTWKQPVDNRAPANMWALAFYSDYKGEMLPYTLLYFVAFPLVIGSLLFEKQWAPTPAGLKAVLVWKDLVIALFLAICYLLLVAAYVPPWFNDRFNPVRPALDFAVRVQLLAVVASLLLFWANWRRFRNAPPIECNVRW
jgi:hypothetical protein